MSAADEIASDLRPMIPTSSFGSQCIPTIAPTPSRPPSLITSSAPPGTRSSAGWNRIGPVPAGCPGDGRSTTPRRARSWCARRARTRGPRRDAGWHTRHPSRPVIASASRSARSASSCSDPPLPFVGVRSHTSPVPTARRRGSQPGQAESFLDQLGRGMLGAAELGMGVEVAAQSDEPFAVLVQPLSQRGESVVMTGVRRRPGCRPGGGPRRRAYRRPRRPFAGVLRSCRRRAT